MRISETAIGVALLLLSQTLAFKHNHGHGLTRLDKIERKHSHMHKHSKAQAAARLNDTPSRDEDAQNEIKRALQGGSSATCKFPTDVGLVAVTPGSGNGGWAMSPDQSCTAGSYCPYACPAGQISMQWDPSVTSYTYPGCQHGGLYCGSDGTVSKPIKGNPYCAEGVGTVSVVNRMSGHHAVCQTVLPGNEAMLIPTSVGTGSTETVAVPGTNYWASTAAHYYHNPPGVSTSDGCIWGDGSKPVGNWSPYVSGANQDASGSTFVKIGWNPIYTGESTFKNVLPSWGIKIECPNGGCNGTPCSIDPSVNKVNEVTSSDAATGAGGGNFCVVTVSKGAKANIVVFEIGSGQTAGTTSSNESSAQNAKPDTSISVAAASPKLTTTSSTTSSSTTSTLSTSAQSPEVPTTSSTSASTSSSAIPTTTSTTTSMSLTDSSISTSSSSITEISSISSSSQDSSPLSSSTSTILPGGVFYQSSNSTANSTLSYTATLARPSTTATANALTSTSRANGAAATATNTASAASSRVFYPATLSLGLMLALWHSLNAVF